MILYGGFSMGLLDLFKKLFATKKRVRQKNGREKLIKSNPKPEEVHSNITRDVGETIPAEKRIQGIKHTPEGLYPHEILLLHYAPSYYIDEESFQGFWWYKYGVRDVKQSLSSLLDRGYLEVGSLQSAIEKETVATLKDILRENNLKVSGKKAELVQRLLDEVPDGQLKNY